VSSRVHALVTTRNGGISEPPYGAGGALTAQAGGLNLGLHTGDDPIVVGTNRARVLSLTGARAAWLEQVHGSDVVLADDVIAAAASGAACVRADASVTTTPAVACVVMVADCLPVLLCDEAGRAVGAAHAGWRGLAAGIIENTARRVAEHSGAQLAELHAYLGPAIGPAAFEVGADVRDVFVAQAHASERDLVARAFAAHPSIPGKYFADLYALARGRLARLGVTRVSGGDACTLSERERFYSYRRDRVTGRMAAMIWLTS
jgi:YfiH family protein